MLKVIRGERNVIITKETEIYAKKATKAGLLMTLFLAAVPLNGITPTRAVLAYFKSQDAVSTGLQTFEYFMTNVLPVLADWYGALMANEASSGGAIMGALTGSVISGSLVLAAFVGSATTA